MKCPVCNNENSKLIFSNFKGHYHGLFDIYQCSKCGVKFAINKNKQTDQLYNKVYSENDFGYYNEYKIQAKEIKNQKEPIKYLAKKSIPYFGVYNLLKKQNNQRTLDIGCGLGYLTYAMRNSGHQATGLDISEPAVKWAKENLGDYYDNESFQIHANNHEKEYDFISALEIIEHLENPLDLLSSIKKALKPDGEALISTPNSLYYPQKAVWNTEWPPIHLWWFNDQSIQELAKKTSLKCQKLNLGKLGYCFFCPNNLLLDYYYSRNFSFNNFSAIKTEDKKTSHSLFNKTVKYLLIDFYPLRMISNFIYLLFNGQTQISIYKLTNN